MWLLRHIDIAGTVFGSLLLQFTYFYIVVYIFWYRNSNLENLTDLRLHMFPINMLLLQMHKSLSWNTMIPSAMSYHVAHFSSNAQRNNQQRAGEGRATPRPSHAHTQTHTPTYAHTWMWKQPRKTNISATHAQTYCMSKRHGTSQNEPRTSDPVRQTQWHALHYPNRAWTIPGFVTMASMITKHTRLETLFTLDHDSVSVAATTCYSSSACVILLCYMSCIHCRHLAARTHSDGEIVSLTFKLWFTLLLRAGGRVRR